MDAGPYSVPAQEQSTIRSELAKYVAAALSRDWEQFTEIFDHEPLCMPAGAPALTTHDEIRAFYSGFPALDSLELVPWSFEAAGHLVIEVGSYELAAGGFQDRGKYIHVWRRTAGSWKLYRNMANSNVQTG